MAMNTPGKTPKLKLAFGFLFEDLYRRDGLIRIDEAFLAHVGTADAGLHRALEEARTATDRGEPSEPLDESVLLMQLAPHVDDFIGTLFGIADQVRGRATRHQVLAPIFACRRLFV